MRDLATTAIRRDSDAVPYAAKDLVGSWTLVEWTIQYADGRTTRPFEPGQQGLLVYAADGMMSATIYSSARPAFDGADVRKQSDAAQAAAFDSYFHYAGRWQARGDDVLHDVTTALNPTMIGTTQVRSVEMSGDSLALSADEPMAGGRGRRRHRLSWRRVKLA